MTAVGAIQDDTGAMVFDKPKTGTLDDPGRQAIRDVVAAAQAYNLGLEALRNRYYVVDGFAPTNF